MAVQESRLVISIDARNAERTAKALNSELQGITNNGNKATSQTNALGTSMQALAGYMAGVVTVSAAINKIDAYTNLQNRLKLVTNSQQELNKAMNDTFGIAQRSYQTWDSVVQVYQRFSDNAKTLGINMEQTAKLTETVSKAVAVSGASTQAAEAALTQFGQALASGTLRGEELNSILEQTPALAKAIAQGIGITVGQLRAVAAEGKITGEVLVDALTKSADSVEQLFAKTDVTISQSIGLLSNELTKFIGEAGQSSGAANLLAGSIKLLSENLSLLADAAVVGGIGYITKAILTKTVAVQGAIAASVAQKAADAAEAQSSIALATAKVNEAKAHLANVQATNAETQAKYGATAANARYKLASDAVTQALIAQTAAQGALNTSVGLGSRALALVGGPIGAITLGVGALAAGYMYLQSRTAEANAKLEEQGKVADKTRQELLALRGVQLDVAKDDLAASFEAQNEALRKADIAFNGFIRTIANGNKQSAEAKEIYEQVRQGLASQEDAIERLNRLNLLTPEQKAQGLDLINTYDEARRKAQDNAEAQKVLKIDVDLAGNAMQNAAGKARDKASAMSQDANATRDAASANREYTQSLQQKLYDQVFLNTVTQKYGKTLQEAQLLLEAQKKTKGQISAEDKKLIGAISQQTKAAENYAKAQSAGAKASNKAQSEAAKEAKRQAKEAERLQEEQYQLREQIAYEYADRIGKIEKDLAREIADIQKAGFASPEQTQGFIQNAQNRAELEKQLYIAQLTQEYSEWQATEEEKLDYRVRINELMIKLDSDLNDDLKNQALQSLKDQANYELAQIELNKEKRLFAANEIFMSEKDKIAERYRLEREEILRNKQLTEQEKQTQIAGTFGREALDTATQQQGVAQNYLGAIGVDYSMEAEFQKKKQAIIAANEFEFITEQEKNQRLLDLEKEFQRAKLNVALSSTEQIFGSLASMFDKNDEEQRKYYRALLAVEKAAAIARSTIAIQSALALAANNPFPLNLVHIATVAAQTASIVGNIKSVSEGFYTGGYTGNMGTREVAGVVHGQEYVLNAEATKRVGRGTLDALNNGGTLGGGEISVNIQNYGTSKAFEVQQIDANTVRIIARDEARNTVAADLQNPNSQISKAASQNLNAPRRRG